VPQSTAPPLAPWLLQEPAVIIGIEIFFAKFRCYESPGIELIPATYLSQRRTTDKIMNQRKLSVIVNMYEINKDQRCFQGINLVPASHKERTHNLTLNNF
jgi:hypothetical protein